MVGSLMRRMGLRGGFADIGQGIARRVAISLLLHARASHLPRGKIVFVGLRRAPL